MCEHRPLGVVGISRREQPRRPGANSVFHAGVVGEAVQDALARLRRGDHRMAAVACVLPRVAVWRIVTAQRGAALLARSELDPRRSNLDALVALQPFRVLDGVDRAQVAARRVEPLQFFVRHRVSICRSLGQHRTRPKWRADPAVVLLRDTLSSSGANPFGDRRGFDEALFEWRLVVENIGGIC